MFKKISLALLSITSAFMLASTSDKVNNNEYEKSTMAHIDYSDEKLKDDNYIDDLYMDNSIGFYDDSRMLGSDSFNYPYTTAQGQYIHEVSIECAPNSSIETGIIQFGVYIDMDNVSNWATLYKYFTIILVDYAPTNTNSKFNCWLYVNNGLQTGSSNNTYGFSWNVAGALDNGGTYIRFHYQKNNIDRAFKILFYLGPTPFYYESFDDYDVSDNLSEVYQDGYNDGRQVGYGEGQTNGYNTGYGVGYNDGYNTGVQESDVNLNDVIMSVPDTFVNSFHTIFDFEIFGVNVLSIIVSIVALGVLLWVVKKFAGGK